MVCDGSRCESTSFDPLDDGQDWHASTVDVWLIEYVLHDAGLLLRHLSYAKIRTHAHMNGMVILRLALAMLLPAVRASEVIAEIRPRKAVGFGVNRRQLCTRHCDVR